LIVPLSPIRPLLTNFFTATEPESPPDKMNRCNSKQMQDKRRKELKRREKRKAAHKSGTTLYADQLSLGPDGMSVRQCAEINKKRNGGIGPSPSTLHHYVVKLGKIGTSPLKKGPEGILDPVVGTRRCVPPKRARYASISLTISRALVRCRSSGLCRQRRKGDRKPIVFGSGLCAILRFIWIATRRHSPRKGG